ncbi:MAG: hypothetical protein KGS45_08750 [Planctomycetes bacterium]|nr:hypothetical protein [Planctomycetota bacterium]
MKNVLSILVVAGVAAAASAQTSAPVVTWQVSTDGGATWGSAAVLNGAGSVKVRGQLGWTGAAGTALAAITFDGSITGAGAGDAGSNLVKPLTQGLGAQAGSFANLGGGNIRFSRSTDSGAPGSNTNWWTIGQDANIDSDGDTVADSFTNQNTSNPVTFLTFDFAVDSTAGVRNIGAILSSNTGSASPIRIYNAGVATSVNFTRAQTAQIGATVEVLIPTPGTLALAGLGGLAAARRRR